MTGSTTQGPCGHGELASKANASLPGRNTALEAKRSPAHRGSLARPSERLDGVQQLAEGLLGVAEEQGGGGLEEELVLDAGEAGAHRALHEDDLLGLVGVEDRHAVDRGAGGG